MLYRFSPAMRAWLRALDLRLLMALHIARWGGFAMLVAAGRLTSPRWSISGGIGDRGGDRARRAGALRLFEGARAAGTGDVLERVRDAQKMPNSVSSRSAFFAASTFAI